MSVRYKRTETKRTNNYFREGQEGRLCLASLLKMDPFLWQVDGNIATVHTFEVFVTKSISQPKKIWNWRRGQLLGLSPTIWSTLTTLLVGGCQLLWTTMQWWPSCHDTRCWWLLSLMIITTKMIFSSGTGFSFTKGGFAENETAVGLCVILTILATTNTNNIKYY